MIEMKPVLLSLLAMAVAAHSFAGITVAERGQASAFTVVIPAKASPSELFAAHEFHDWTFKLTGVRIPIREKTSVTAKAIYLNREKPDPALGEEGFELEAVGGDIRVSGGKRGVLYGVYELLERFGGIAWLDAGFTDIPKTDVFEIPVDLKDRQLPAFARRVHDWRRVGSDLDFCARSRINHYYLRECHGGSYAKFDGPLGWCHTFNYLVNPDKYFDGHPEYFSFFKGKRQKSYSQLCLTNPDVFKIVLEKTLERIRFNESKTNNVKYYGISQNDWNGYCECEKCAAIDAREESHAGALIDFLNRIAAEVEKQYPDVVIETLAYMYSRKPPKNLKPRHNVMPLLCSIECDFSKPMAESRFKENVAFRSDLEKWRKISNHLMIWDYAGNWRATPCPQHNLRTVWENSRYYRAQGVTELFHEGKVFLEDGQSEEFAALKAYLASKAMWNPDRPMRPVMERFCNAYYGKGAPFVLEYIDLLERQPVDETTTPLIYSTTIDKMPWTDKFLGEARVLWRKAEAAAADESASVKSNIFWGAFCADYTVLAKYIQGGEWRPVIVSEKFASSMDKAKFAKMRSLAQDIVEVMDKRSGQVVLSSRLNDFRHKGLVRALAAAELPSGGGAGGKAVVQDCLITYNDFPKSKTIFRERDEGATDGWVIHVHKSDPGWLMSFNMNNAAAFDDNVKYRLRVRVRVTPEEGVAPEKAIVSLGLFDRNVRKDVLSASVSAAVSKGEWTWVDLGEWTAKNDNYIFYAGSRGCAFKLDSFEITR